MHGQEDDLHPRIVLLQLHHRVNPAQLRHADVRYDHVRLQFPGAEKPFEKSSTIAWEMARSCSVKSCGSGNGMIF